MTPDTPVSPDVPVTPDTPVTPDVPVSPDVPVTPDASGDVVDPVTPVTPADPEPVVPDVPVTPDTPDTPVVEDPVAPEDPGNLDHSSFGEDPVIVDDVNSEVDASVEDVVDDLVAPEVDAITPDADEVIPSETTDNVVDNVVDAGAVAPVDGSLTIADILADDTTGGVDTAIDVLSAEIIMESASEELGVSNDGNASDAGSSLVSSNIDNLGIGVIASNLIGLVGFSLFKGKKDEEDE